MKEERNQPQQVLRKIIFLAVYSQMKLVLTGRILKRLTVLSIPSIACFGSRFLWNLNGELGFDVLKDRSVDTSYGGCGLDFYGVALAW